ncbi:lasso peptide isopeptide bond-forming cyclase [Merismopedia glauca]|uniref:asparagine synthase (glutamine-hydrolyzing) n=1 Tax=Merismopedia glauca CCAP 1448/3 TaxID=1296344 RepID=A0A2T1C4V3_9CYAN|nr:lasso peptide isopeptide bond-forming cyclase [Merismopedia glauca]PSB03312.1 asparagine synthase (glutamine-hydrolyzing) [Merismopedia glauca CCAP 1448/3]
MSAIAGIYYLDNRVIQSTDLEPMMNSLAHRGVNDSGIWCEDGIGFGHQMLWVTPESMIEKLPLVSQNSSFVITADARIDNRDELISSLGVTSQVTDTQLILSAYEKWGEGCLEHLVGDFAFAIWDSIRKQLFCARDHFGVKPFFYHYSPQIFVFGTEITAVLSVPEVPRQINKTRIGEYLIPALEDKITTFYEDIWRLPPAHYAICSRQGFQIKSYGSLDPTRKIELESDEAYAAAFRDIFTQAVKCRLRSAFPVGSTLSGGLDSSSITCVAREILKKSSKPNLHTFSAIFDTVTQCDERPYINAVVAQGNLNSHYVCADTLSPLTDIERMLSHQGEAFFAPNLFMHWGLYGAAQQQGMRVFLDGMDGDTTVSHGIAYLTELASTWRWFTLAEEIKLLAQRFSSSPRKLLWIYGIRPLVPQTILRLWQILYRGKKFSWNDNPTINPKFAREIALEERLQAFKSNPAKTARESHYRGLSHGMMPYILEVADPAAAAFHLEPRYPFFDKRLVEFCLAIPPEQKISQGWTRMVMRRAMENILPPKVQWRGGKANLSANFIHGLSKGDRPLLDEIILKDPTILAPYLDINRLHQVYHQFIDRGSNSDGITIWKAAILALWLQQSK